MNKSYSALHQEVDQLKVENELLKLKLEGMFTLSEIRLKHIEDKCPACYDENTALKESLREVYQALHKIAEAERVGYGTQRTYGAMAQAALDKIKPKIESIDNE